MSRFASARKAPLPTFSQLARKRAERDERRQAALRVLLEWDAPTPPICAVLSVRELYSLARDGLTEMVGRDRLDDPRFVLTPAGRQVAAGL